MRRFLPLILVLASLLIDVTIVPALARHWAIPLTLLMTVVVMGLLLGRTRGLFYGMIGGVLMDVLVGSPMGMMSALYMASGYISGVAGRKFQRYLLTVFITPILCFALYEGTLAIYMLMAGRILTGNDLWQMLGRIGIQTVLCQLIYMPYNKILSPIWSRYAGR